MTEELKLKIKKLIESGSEEVIDLESMMPIRDMEDYLKTLGFKDLDINGDELNGWQVDFWYKFEHKKYGTYCLSGSLHHGDFKFGKYVD